ncbi:MAG: AAA family ATPase [Proteobacteria bacterium]|nr:AAA family ATPase [Pseudomonadota bacterium]
MKARQAIPSKTEQSPVVEKRHDAGNVLELSRFRELRENEMRYPGIIARSQKMESILRLAEKVAKVDINLLVSGESGVGKNVVTRLIHQNSCRRKSPFIEINCGAIPENLLESELFGYEPGSFTGASKSGKSGMIEAARNGTLFLNEISELPLSLQVKILRVIQEKKVTKIGGHKTKEVDFRLIAATNQDLGSKVKTGEFRKDLYYRLNVVPIIIPPLRERREDILPLISFFLEQANKQYKKKKTLSYNAVDTLLSYNWPGNVRELQHLIERIVITEDEENIRAVSLPDVVKGTSSDIFNEDLTLQQAKELLESKMIQRAFERYKTTVGVGKALGISQSSAARKLKKHISTYSVSHATIN